MVEPLPASQIRMTLAIMLAGAVGNTQEHWASLIEIEVLNIVFNIQGNWRVEASGTANERAAITEAARIFATQYRYAFE